MCTNWHLRPLRGGSFISPPRWLLYSRCSSSRQVGFCIMGGQWTPPGQCSAGCVADSTSADSKEINVYVQTTNIKNLPYLRQTQWQNYETPSLAASDAIGQKRAFLQPQASTRRTNDNTSKQPDTETGIPVFHPSCSGVLRDKTCQREQCRHAVI